MTTSGLFRCLLHTIFPTNCATCGDFLWDDPIPFFCRRCWSQISPIPSPVCPRCARPFASSYALSHSPNHECGQCRRRPPSYNHARTPYAYQSPLKEAIVLLKHKGKTQLAPLLAQLMAQTGPPVVTIDAIVAVPLHPTRLRKREFNQSLLLARSLGKTLEPSRIDQRSPPHKIDPTANVLEPTSAFDQSSKMLCGEEAGRD